MHIFNTIHASLVWVQPMRPRNRSVEGLTSRRRLDVGLTPLVMLRVIEMLLSYSCVVWDDMAAIGPTER